MARIGITGATGFLGRHSLRGLHAEGHDVVGLGRDGATLTAMAREGFDMRRCDIGDREALPNALTGCEVVVHCAARSSPWGSFREFHDANVAGTENLLEACRRNRVRRLIHISTPSIYVTKQDRFDIGEEDALPPRFINHYAHTKWLAEELVRESGLESIILRPQGIIGVGDRAILPRIMRLGRKGIIPCFGNGGQQIDLTHVDNVVSAISLSIKASPEAVGRSYNITNGSPVVQLEVIEEILRRLGFKVRRKKLPFAALYLGALTVEEVHRLIRPSVEPSLTGYGICALAFSRTLSIRAAQERLGYNPSPFDMEEYIKSIIEERQAHGSH